MDRFYGGGFPYNIPDGNQEIFGNQLDPNYRFMHEPEIPVDPQVHYWNDNPQEMRQIYYDSDPYYGNNGYHSPRHGSNFIYTPQAVPLDYRQQTEYPSYQISVHIRFSRRGVIDNGLMIDLQREGLSCEVRGRADITVSGYPADDGAGGILELVRQISGDRGARIVG